MSFWEELIGEVDAEIDAEEGYNNAWWEGEANVRKTGGDIETGADTGAIRDKSDTEQVKFSNEYYESIRNRKSKSDIEAIAKNTGFATSAITAIRAHIFEEIHDLGDGRIGRFDSDWRTAQAWQRLEMGEGTELDILLLNHELYELTLMKEKGYDYNDAHIQAHEKYPWATEWEKEFGGN